MQAGKAFVRLCECTGSSKLWWLTDVIRPNKKKIPVFRVTQPYLNLLLKPRKFFRFSGKKYNFILSHLLIAGCNIGVQICDRHSVRQLSQLISQYL